MMDIDTMLHVTHPPLWAMWLGIGWMIGDFLSRLATLIWLRRKP
jgi:hypothetical protein